MCGRFSLTNPPEELFDYPEFRERLKRLPEMPPRYNIAPTQPILVVRQALGGETGALEPVLVRWGLVPSWAKEPEKLSLMINARSETAVEKPSFRAAMRHRRVLIPASGFYEWKRYGRGRKSQAYWVRPRHGGIVVLGGLMETWAGPDGSEVDTGCIMTTAANETFSAIHDRLPLVIKPENFDRWLDCRTQEPREVADLLHPVDDDYFEAVPVGDKVNKVANSGPDVQERVIPVEPESAPPTDSQLSMF